MTAIWMIAIIFYVKCCWDGLPMRMSQNEKVKSGARIVASASRLFRERGLSGASVADVMTDAGMTHGGFYKHFDSKDALVVQALESAFAEFAGMLDQGEAEAALAAFRTLYLSADHKANPGHGCPIAALGPEIARAAPTVKVAFGAGVQQMVEAIARLRKGSSQKSWEAALRELSMLVGALVIARACDDGLGTDVLAACCKGDAP